MQRAPGTNYKPLIRCKGQLAPATVFTGSQTPLYEIHAVAGCARVSARIYCPTGGGNIALVFMGPDVDVDRVMANAPAYAAITGYVTPPFNAPPYSQAASTLYATGNPTAVAVPAATEAQIISDVYGESYVIVQFTPNAPGTIGYCDVSRI